jgi:SAM-dependent methyltransferase
VLTVEPERLAVAAGERVLDLGCGGGRHAYAFLRAGADVVALDSSDDESQTVAGMVLAMREAGELAEQPFAAALCGDALALPFATGSFDIVVASEVLEHLPNDRAAIGEVVRVLRPGGRLALSVPRRGPERVNWALSQEYHEVEGGHVRIYRRRALEALLTEAGLRLLGRTYRHGLHSPYWWLRCAVGVAREDHRLVSWYHRFLVWDIVRRPLLTRALDALLNPLIGKSLVLYLERPA